MKTTVYLTLTLGFVSFVTMNGQDITTNQPNAGNAPSKQILVTLDNQLTDKNIKSSKTSLPEITPQISQGQVDRLLREAEEISLKATALRREAKASQADQKNMLIGQAAKLEQNAMSKQVVAGEMTGELNMRKYLSNRSTIDHMIDLHKGKPILNHAKFLITESEKNIKVAHELRKEASTLSHLPSRLGTMSNAEEKEILALSNQDDAIGMLKQTLY